jgi:hypothetical protein
VDLSLLKILCYPKYPTVNISFQRRRIESHEVHFISVCVINPAFIFSKEASSHPYVWYL